MKSSKIKLIMFSALCVGSVTFAQKSEVNTEKSIIIAEMAAKEDNAAIVAANKKRAAEEKAKLPKPYDATENAEAIIAELVKKAKTENKNIILQAGGNWCIWCLRFNNFVQTTPELKQIVDANYLYYHLNYSPENKNEKVFAKYENPGAKFGYPVFIVLDQNGKMIHTQDSAVLEEGKGYSKEKVKEFFEKWTPKS